MLEAPVLILWFGFFVLTIFRGVINGVNAVFAGEPKKRIAPWPVTLTLLVVELGIYWVWAYVLVGVLG